MLGGADRVLINQIPESWLNSPSMKGLLKLKNVVNSQAQIAPRRGSFEIYANIGAPQNKQFVIPVFSKLMTTHWPSFAVVRDRCNTVMSESESG